MSDPLEKRAVVFDLGMVLVHVEIGGVFDFLRAKGLPVADPAVLAETVDLSLYETGKLSDREFYQRLLALADAPFSFAEWAGVWTRILTPSMEMLDLADRLARRYPVYILSNTNPLHFEVMERDLGLRCRFAGIVTSFEAGTMKPDAAIYAHAERQFGVAAPELVFFDDREENVRGARAAGWVAHRFEGYASALAVLTGLGFETEAM